VRLPRGADRDAVVADLDQRGVQAKAYMPSIHLMSHMPQRFGFPPGQFPVAGEAAVAVREEADAIGKAAELRESRPAVTLAANPDSHLSVSRAQPPVIAQSDR